VFDYDAWARLLEGLMEVGTIEDCAALFDLMEKYADVFESPAYMQVRVRSVRANVCRAVAMTRAGKA
jgi:hypothetical protein